MGNCGSTPAVKEDWQQARGDRLSPTGQYKFGKNAHDSVHSLDTAGTKDTASSRQPNSKQYSSSNPDAPNSTASSKFQFRPNKGKKQHGKHAQQQQSPPQQHPAATAHITATSGSSSKQRRPPGFDISSGKAIPDFHVNGVLDVLYELGSGGSGTTYLCRDLAAAKLIAVKFVPRPLPKAAVPLMLAEVELQAQLGEGHANIITMRELLLTRTHLALMMDYASGGALTHRVSDLWESALQRGGLHMEEQEACYYLRQFISALEYLHQHKVAHRDLKLDNTLLEDRLGPAYVRICDFGFAKAWDASDNMKTAIGTPVYMSPQMLAAKQCASGYSGVKADMWAAGVLLFVMLLGAFPFDHAENLDPNSRQASNEVWLRQQAPGGWRKHPLALEALSRQRLSPDCCELLDGLLEMDEEKRLTTSQVQSHPWMHQTLLPDQQKAWEELQQEQQQLTQVLEQKSDIYKIRLRKQAMTAMLAFAAKPPGRTSLLPQPSAALSPQASISTNNSTAAAAAAAAPLASPAASAPVPAPAPQQQQEQVAAAQPAAAAAAAAAGDKVSKVSAPESAPTSPLTAASGAQRTDSIPEGEPLSSPFAAGAAGAAAAAGAASPTDDATAAAAVTDVESFRVGADGGSVMDGNTQHMSFKTGQGIRSDSLEAKVEAYRQQLVEVRAARMAAAHQHEQTQGAAAPPPPVKQVSPFAAAAGPIGPAANSTDSSNSTSLTQQQQQQQQQRLSPPLSPNGSAGSASPTASSNSGSKKGSMSRKNTTTSSGSFNLRALFTVAPSRKGSGAAAATAAAGAAGGVILGGDDDDKWDNTPDDVWRIPLTSTADPAAYKLSPELSVAAGALVSQLQKNGRIEGRGRTNRSSCPVYSN